MNKKRKYLLFFLGYMHCSSIEHNLIHVTQDLKPKFVPHRMTHVERNNLKAFIQKTAEAAHKAQDTEAIAVIEQIAALCERLDSTHFVMHDSKDEKLYTAYFKLLTTEIEHLGHDPQVILQMNALRKKFLEGVVEHLPWFVKEIQGIKWFFEQDAEHQFPSKKTDDRYFIIQQWPKAEDKVLYLIALAEQVDRAHQRLHTEDLLLTIETLHEQFIALISLVPPVFRRAIHHTLNKLTHISNIRGISLSKKKM